jgi:CRP-like cAMP-binding protein
MKEISLTADDFKDLSTMLRDISFFSKLSMGGLERLLSMTRLYEVRTGEVVFRKGEVGDALYVVQSGAVDVYRRKFTWIPGGRLARLSRGDFFGEMALLDQPYRTATVVAQTTTRVFVILASHFNDLLRGNPEMAASLRDVAAKRSFAQKHSLG